MKNFLLSLLTHNRLIVRFLSAWLIGTVIMFAAWFISDTWLPDKFFRFLPGFAISPTECEIGSLSETIKTFSWNMLLSGGLCIVSSLFAVGRFPLGYLVPWIIFANYGGMLGTDTFLCSNPLESPGIDISILWTRAGFREITGYLFIPVALANLYLWRQRSFWSTHLERVRQWSEFHFSWELVLALAASIGLIAWGAIEEVFNFV